MSQRVGATSEISAILGRSVDPLFTSAMVLGFFDWLVPFTQSRASLTDLFFILCIVSASSVVPTSVLVLISTTAQRIDRRIGHRRRWASAFAAAILALPVLPLATKMVMDPGTMTALVAVFAGFTLTAAFICGQRAPSPTAWGFSAMISTAILIWANASLALPWRVSSKEMNVFLLLFLSGTVGCVAMAFAISRLIHSCTGGRISRPLRALALITGIAMFLLVVLATGPHLSTPRRAAFLGAWLVLGLGVCGVRFRLSVRMGALGLAVVGVVYTTFFESAFSPIRWTIGADTALARELTTAVDLFRPGFYKAYCILKQRPETREGAALARRAIAWNRRRSRASARYRRASILVVTIDALRFDHVGYSGQAPKGLTPTIDALARDSQRFSHCYAQGGWTSISISSMFWARYPKEIVFTRLVEEESYRLHFADEAPPGIYVAKVFQSPKNEPNQSLAEVLSVAGFNTVAVPNDGFTHYFNPHFGFTRGFRRIVYPRHEAKERIVKDDNDVLALNLAVSELKRLKDEQYFVWVHFFAPHGGYEGFNGYKAELHSTDRRIGQLIDTLRSTERLRDTIVVIAGDHGEGFGEHGRYGHGLDLHEESMRVPLLVRLPGYPPGEVKTAVGLIDIAPTLLDLTGVPIPESMHGFSLTRLMEGKPGANRPMVTMETWRNERHTSRKSLHLVGAVHGQEKVILDWRTWNMSYYQLGSDPAERHNLLARPRADTMERFSTMAAKLIGWYCSSSSQQDPPGGTCP